MRRRGHGEGSIYQRPDGRWAAIIDLGWHDGKRRRRFAYGKSRAAVAARLVTMLRAKQQGLPSGSDRVTVGAYLEKWIEGAEAAVRATTALRYRYLIRKQLVPRLGRIALSRLAPHDLTAAYSAMIADGLAPRTAGHAHRLLGRVLRDAEAAGLVGRNVARLVKPPRVPHQEMRALMPEEARALLRAVEGHRLAAFYALALSTGAREGELLALRWSDLDEAGSLAIRRTLVRTASGFTFADPKTATSRRSIPLGVSAVEALRTHRRRQAEERLRAGAAWADNDLVFATELGTPIDPSNLLRRTHYPILERARLPRVRIHDLRHTAATLMLGQGVHPKVVSERLGHATPTITLSLYSHVTPTMQREAAAALDAVLSG